ncbi:MAG: FG-GAP repeat domain-containing protein, partial [Anaerolineae bacterium]
MNPLPLKATGPALALGLTLVASCGRGGVGELPEESPGLRTAAEWTAADFAGFCEAVTQGSRYWGPGPVEEQRVALEEARRAGAAPVEEARLAALLGEALLRSGDLPGAKTSLDGARRLAREGGVPLSQAWGTWWLSALTYLRVAEVANCIAAPSSAGCFLDPLPTGSIIAEGADARAAQELLLEGLKFQPSPRFRLAAAWLVSLVAVLDGDDPASVPEELRVDFARFESPSGLASMTEVARDLGVDALDLAGGSVVDDLNGDGYLDIASTTMDPCGGAHLYLNDGDGTFTDASATSGLAAQPGALNVIQADYDNDGFTDLLLLRGAWLFSEGRHRNSLLHNDGDGTFSDVTAEAGLATPAYPTQVAAWADYDGDGWLDVFIGNEEAGKDQPYPSQLFRNNGDGTFTDVAGKAGVSNNAMAKGAAWGDIDNDGDPDLYVVNLGPNRLYVNNGDGIFSDQTAAWGVLEPLEHNLATWFW